MKLRWQPSLQIVPHFESEPLYINALRESLKKKMRELKWKPVTNFKTGINLTFDWYNKNIVFFKRISKKDITKRLGNK